MHDLDRTQNMFELNDPAPDYEEDYETDFEEDYETDYEFSDDFEIRGDYEVESPFDEATEMDLAAELLTVSDDAELEQFLGKLFKKASRAVRKIARSPVFSALKGPLKSIVRKSLPIAGGALGGMFGGPAGAALGSKLASMGGRMFGLELEGLSPEDQEFEIARRVVKLAGSAAKKAALAPPSVPAKTVAQKALVSAAKLHAPGLLKSPTSSYSQGLDSRRSGKWVRRGRKIILYGV